MKPLSVAVLGAGNWGTTLAHLVAANGNSCKLWTRSDSLAREINETRANTRSVPGLVLASGARATSSLGEALAEASLVIVAIPSQGFREVSRLAAPMLRPDHRLIHVTKGLELHTLRRMSEIVVQETCVRQLGVLSGPNIAPEIAVGKPAGTVIASSHPQVVDAGRRALSSTQLMVFSATDVAGIELSGALKNVVAIAAGMAEELAVGENAKAFLITRGLAEMMRLASALGAVPATLMGLAGIGDLMVTCRSPQSRNYRVGVGLARGELLDDVVARLGMVAEGIYAASAAQELAREHAIAMPLFEHVHRVLREGMPPRQALERLMKLPAGRDVGQFVCGG
jgi:glycerol-3-phosphate dehydrogenase (NAD(P)+)